MKVLDILEVIGIAAFAASGAIMAIDKKLDIFGIIVLAFITAVGGGVLRDVVIDAGIPEFFSNYLYGTVILCVAIAVILLRDRIHRSFIFVMIDALGLAVFTVVAGVKAMGEGYTFLAFLFVSLITGTGGGLMRDLMVMEIPLILRREIYATAALTGAVVLWLTMSWIGRTPATILSVAVVFAVRVICYRKGVHLTMKKLAA